MPQFLSVSCLCAAVWPLCQIGRKSFESHAKPTFSTKKKNIYHKLITFFCFDKIQSSTILKLPFRATLTSLFCSPKVSFQEDSSSEEEQEDEQDYPRKRDLDDDTKRPIYLQSYPSIDRESLLDLSWKMDNNNGSSSVNHQEPQLKSPLLTDREKRCLAVPIGEIRDLRKTTLGRTRSLPQKSTWDIFFFAFYYWLSRQVYFCCCYCGRITSRCHHLVFTWNCKSNFQIAFSLFQQGRW